MQLPWWRLFGRILPSIQLNQHLETCTRNSNLFEFISSTSAAALSGVWPRSGVNCSQKEGEVGDGDPRKHLRLAKCQLSGGAAARRACRHPRAPRDHRGQFSEDSGGAKPRFHGFRISETSAPESLRSDGLSFWKGPRCHLKVI